MGSFLATYGAADGTWLVIGLDRPIRVRVVETNVRWFCWFHLMVVTTYGLCNQSSERTTLEGYILGLPAFGLRRPQDGQTSVTEVVRGQRATEASKMDIVTQSGGLSDRCC